jgi:UDP-hydrolysing UDP-N-acetyl-D-glucosamine 2-epimerase
MTRKIAVFTGTRAEYGLLYWLMKDIQASSQLELQLIVGAMHLSPEFGETWQQIEQDGFDIDAKVEMLLSSNTPVGVAKSMGLGTIGFADALDRLRPDALVILGDRFEALAIAQAALIMHIPIAHLHGGELTEGAYDDSIRHAITKMASLHFVATEPYRKRVIQMGERPDNVFRVGALGLDHLTRSSQLSFEDLRASLGFELQKPYFLVTYHPATAAEEDPVTTFSALLGALDQFPDYQVIITYPNADNGGRKIIPLLKQYAQQQPERVFAIESLGLKRYLSAAANAAAVIGNSSSGIIEVPALGVPTVDVGHRQKGRLAANSIVHCDIQPEAILSALATVLTPAFTLAAKSTSNPYGCGNAAADIVRILEHIDVAAPKKFYDLH